MPSLHNPQIQFTSKRQRERAAAAPRVEPPDPSTAPRRPRTGTHVECPKCGEPGIADPKVQSKVWHTRQSYPCEIEEGQ